MSGSTPAEMRTDLETSDGSDGFSLDSGHATGYPVASSLKRLSVFLAEMICCRGVSDL